MDDLHFSPDRLRHLRVEAHLRQKDLADEVGVDPVTVSSWENGYWVPRLHLIVRTARVLGCDLTDLLEGSPPSSAGDDSAHEGGTDNRHPHGRAARVVA